jgi:hypothetical protein
MVLDTGREAVARRWQLQFQDQRDAVKALCRRHAIHFMEMATADRPLRALQVGLTRRGKTV